jgi:hypothetical protein
MARRSSAARPLPHVVADTARDLARMAPAETLPPQWSRNYERMLQGSLALFASDVLGIELGPHMLEWDDLVNTKSRIGINAARDHSKTTYFSYAYPIWRAWGDPGCEVYLFSNTQDQAMEFLDAVVYGRNNLKGLLGTPQLAGLVPAEGRRESRTRLKRTDVRLRNGSRIRALGYGKAVRGAHPKYIVLDDPLNDEDMYSELIRKKRIEYCKSAIINMVQPGGQLVAVGTPYHISDLWGWIRKNTEWTFKSYPGIYKDAQGNERALFPWRWPLDALKKKLREIGSVAFAREILCLPITDDLAIFPSWLFPPLFDKTLCCRPKRSVIRARGLSVFIGVDIARSASVGADYFVIFVIGVDALGNHYILDIQRHKGLRFKTQLDMITLAARRYGADLVVIEANAMQQVWSDEMIRTTDVPVKAFVTTAQNKYPLDKGVPSLRIVLENQKMVIPRGDEYSVRVTDEWIAEAIQFGFIDGKLQGIGEHDDQIYAWWMSEEGAKMGGFSFGVGDEDEKKDADAVEAAKDDEMTGGVGDWEQEYLGSEEDEEKDDDADDRDVVDDSLFESAFGDGKRKDEPL